MTARWAPLVTVRTAQYDIWASQFLAVHPHATVVHLGCGLDSRVFRLDPGPGVEWYDVDYPAVIALREKLYPTRDRVPPGCHFGDRSVLARPDSRRPPGAAVGRGHQHVPDGIRRRRAAAARRRPVPVRRTADRLLQLARDPVAEDADIDAASGSTLYWAVNGPQDILERVSGLRLLTAVTFFDASTFSRTSTAFRLAERLVRAVPPLRRDTAIPPLRLRARQLTPLATCSSAVAQNSERITSIDLSGAGPCEWYSTFSLPGEDLGEVDLDTGADREVQLAVGTGQFQIGRCTHGRDQSVVGKQDDIGHARWIPDVLRAEVKPRLLDHTVGEVFRKVSAMSRARSTTRVLRSISAR